MLSWRKKMDYREGESDEAPLSRTVAYQDFYTKEEYDSREQALLADIRELQKKIGIVKSRQNEEACKGSRDRYWKRQEGLM